MPDFVRRSGTAWSASGGKAPPKQNILVQVKNISIDNPRASNPDKDYLIGYLMHDVEGAPKFERDPEGVPITEVKVMCRPLGDDGKGAARRDIYGLSRPKNGPAMNAPGCVVALEDCVWNKGMIVAGYSSGLAEVSTMMGDYVRYPVPNTYCMVLPEGVRRVVDPKNPGKDAWVPSGSQIVALALPSVTSEDLSENPVVPIANEDDLRQQIAYHVQVHAEQGWPGAPGCIVTARQLAPEGHPDPVDFACSMQTRRAAWKGFRDITKDDGQTWVKMTADEAYTAFCEDAQVKKELSGIIGNPGWVVEFVPLLVTVQSTNKTPSKATSTKFRDESLDFAIFGAYDHAQDRFKKYPVEFNGEKYVPVNQGFALSNVMLYRADPSSGAWSAIYSKPTLKYNYKVRSIHEFPTPMMPEYHVKACEMIDEYQNEQRKKYYDLRKAALAAAAAPAPEQASAPAQAMTR